MSLLNFVIDIFVRKKKLKNSYQVKVKRTVLKGQHFTNFVKEKLYNTNYIWHGIKAIKGLLITFASWRQTYYVFLCRIRIVYVPVILQTLKLFVCYCKMLYLKQISYYYFNAIVLNKQKTRYMRIEINRKASFLFSVYFLLANAMLCWKFPVYKTVYLLNICICWYICHSSKILMLLYSCVLKMEFKELLKCAFVKENLINHCTVQCMFVHTWFWGWS